MRTLIRSCIVVKIADAPELLLQNLLALDRSGLEPETPEDKTIWAIVRDFAKLHQHAPDVKTVQLQIQAATDLAALDYLEQLVREPLKTRGDFIIYLERKIEERRVSQVVMATMSAKCIATTGLEIEGDKGRKQFLRGTDAALEYLRTELRQVERAPNGAQTSGGVTGAEAAAGLRAEYENAKISPVIGNLTGLIQIDTTLGGGKNKELWTHAAFSGHLKSTFAANWAYNLAFHYRRSVLYFSLEMTFEQVRRQLTAMHSYHYKFREVRFHLGLQASEDLDAGLDYDKIRDGQLAPAEEEFYLGHVLPDMEDEANAYGKIDIRKPDPDKKRFTLEDLRDAAERSHAETPFTQIFVDHLGLVDSENVRASERDALVEVMKGLHKLAANFRRGAGTSIVGLAQINREGLKTLAKKKETGRLPRYLPVDLFGSSEVEKSSDVITTSYIDDDLSQRGRVFFDCLKARDLRKPDPFLAKVVWASKRILCCDEKPLVEVPVQTTRRRQSAQDLPTVLFDALDADSGAPSPTGSRA